MYIDLFRIDEYDHLIALWDRAGLPCERDGRDSRNRIENQLYDDHVAIFTMKDDAGRIIGSIIGSSDGRKGWINRLAVDPDFRGRRLGERLVERAEAFLQEKGVEVIGALIEDQNYPSMALFRRCGYAGWDKIIYFRKKTAATSDDH